jgi:hypothetical protein
MPLLRSLQEAAQEAVAGGPMGDTDAAVQAAAAHAAAQAAAAKAKLVIDVYSALGDVICLLSLLAGMAVIRKLWRPATGLGGRSVTGPHSMKRFMDRVVLVMSVIDVLFAAVLVVTLTVTWRLWYFQGPVNHTIWWAFAQWCWLPQFYHCYIASVCYKYVFCVCVCVYFYYYYYYFLLIFYKN